MDDRCEYRTTEIYPTKCDTFDEYSNDNEEALRKIVRNGHFDRVHKDELTYDKFFREYLRPNVPVVVTGIADDWECQHWIRPAQCNSGCGLHFDYLKEKIPKNVIVPVANCHREYFNSHEKLDMNFHEYLDYWNDRLTKDRADVCNTKLLYLKDWHLRRQLPEYHYYQTPVYFGSDWLNEYCEAKQCDDYRFVYMGPKGTWYVPHKLIIHRFH